MPCITINNNIKPFQKVKMKGRIYMHSYRTRDNTYIDLVLKKGVRADRKSRFKHLIKPYLFLLPILFFAFAFSYYPFVKTVIYSLSRVNKQGEIGNFVGLQNFINIFQRKEFINAIIVTLKFVLLYVPIAVTFPYLLALMACRTKPFSKVYQTLYALPMAVSASAACLIFKQLLQRKAGLLNYGLDLLGFYVNRTNIDWLNSTKWALPMLAAISIWIHMGFNFMLFLAAIRNVPSELVESAKLDGCGYWRMVFNIIVPNTSPTIFFVVCTQMISGIMMNAPTMILTKGGPLNTTSTLVYYVYTSGFRASNYSVGSAASIVTFLLALIFLLFNFIYEKKGVSYD